MMKSLFNTPIRLFALALVSLPLFGLLFSIVWSVLFDFRASTATHCNVPNFLPSVSAAIALTPQAYVWRACIALHSAPRYLINYSYWNWYSRLNIDNAKTLFPLRRFMTLVALCGNFTEISALLGLTLVSSTENFEIHEGCFIAFMVGSLVYMIIACLLNCITTMESEHQKYVARFKRRAVIVYITAFVLSLYFYFRHHSYCEPGVYSLFAICEYIVILSNMSFHYTFGLDFEDFSVCVSCFGNSKLTS